MHTYSYVYIYIYREREIWNFPKSLSQVILAGIILVGRSGARASRARTLFPRRQVRLPRRGRADTSQREIPHEGKSLIKGAGVCEKNRLGEIPYEGKSLIWVPASVKKTLLLGEPLPCLPEAETALQTLIWHSEG